MTACRTRLASISPINLKELGHWSNNVVIADIGSTFLLSLEY